MYIQINDVENLSFARLRKVIYDIHMKSKKVLSFIIAVLSHRYAFHVYFWVFIFYRNFLLISKRNAIEVALTYSGASVIVAMIPVYAHFSALSLLYKKKIFLYSLALAGILLCGGFIDNIVFMGLFKQKLSLFKSIYDIGGVIFITTALKYIKHGITERFLLQEIKAKQLETELATLKSQINPHFLFNTLNNLYGLALVGSKKTPETILKLSDLMRYILDTAQHRLVSMSDEIDFLGNYIELEKLRFESGEVAFTVTGNPETKMISPMMFIPFVENAFKHGIDTTAGDCDIAIRFEITQDNIIFSSSNKLYPDMVIQRHGSGIANVQRRLELLYPGKHRLDIVSDATHYAVRLEIDI